MKRFYRLLICVFVCMSVVFACATMSSAAATLAKVKKVTVSSVKARKVTLKWKKVSGATGYRIYRYNANKKKYAYVGKTTKRTFTDTKVKAGKAYSYKVRAYKTKKNKTTSGKYSAAVKAVTTPKGVKNFRATYVGTNMVNLEWNKAKGASAYEIFIYDSSTGNYISKGSIENNGCSLKNLESNTTYKIKVVPYHNKNGKVYGPQSKVLTFTTNIPAVLSMKVSDVKSNSYTLSWTAVKDAAGYEIYKYNTSTKGWDCIFTTVKTSYTVTGVTSGTADQYKVRPYILKDGEIVYGGFCPSVTANTIAGMPSDLVATTDNKTVSLSWTANGTVTGYEVCRYNAANGSWETIGVTASTSYTDDTVDQTSSYTYKVRGYVQADTNYYTEYTPSVTVFYESYNEPQSIYSQQMAEEGVLGYLYDASENCFYTASDPWHRELGYNELYDTFAPLTLINIETKRLKFDYKDKNWMIQVWKGQYGMVFYGAEIGVYNKPMDRELEHYDCASDDELLKMSFDFYEYKIFKGTWEKQFSRPYGSYWWCTGFIPGNKLGRFDTLRVDARITMTDYDMLVGVKAALDGEGVSYTVNGLNVYFSY